MPTLSWKLLQQLLVQPGWTKATKDIYISGKLGVDGKLDVPPPPKSTEKAVNDEWNNAPITREFLGKEVDCVARCIEHYIKEGKIGSDKFVFAVVTSFCEVE
jgi:hypothetical protein